jgi:hypothetical protein
VSATTTPYPHEKVTTHREAAVTRMELQHGLLDDCLAGVRDRQAAAGVRDRQAGAGVRDRQAGAGVRDRRPAAGGRDRRPAGKPAASARPDRQYRRYNGVR